MFGVFGVDVDFDGTIRINPKKTKLAKELTLKGLKKR